MHYLQFSRIYEKLVDNLVNTCYNKITVKTSTADKQSSRQNRQRVQIDLVQWRLAFLIAIFENSHALQLNCNMFR